MNDYVVNEEKPEQLLLGYITIVGPDIHQVYDYIVSESPVDEDQIVEKMFDEDESSGASHNNQCLRFLRSVDMVEQADNGYQAINTGLHGELNFRLKLLHHLQRQTGKQSSVRFVWDFAMDEEIIETNISGLKTEIERSDDNTYQFSWTQPKLGMWRDLMGYVGLAKVTTEGKIRFSPQRKLLLDLFQYYRKLTEDNSFIGFFEFFAEQFGDCFSTTNPPTLHPGISEPVFNMIEEGVLKAQSLSDAQEVRLNVPSLDEYHSYTSFQVKHKQHPSLVEGEI